MDSESPCEQTLSDLGWRTNLRKSPVSSRLVYPEVRRVFPPSVPSPKRSLGIDDTPTPPVCWTTPDSGTRPTKPGVRRGETRTGLPRLQGSSRSDRWIMNGHGYSVLDLRKGLWIVVVCHGPPVCREEPPDHVPTPTTGVTPHARPYRKHRVDGVPRLRLEGVPGMVRSQDMGYAADRSERTPGGEGYTTTVAAGLLSDSPSRTHPT